ncbi:MAG: putative aminopeptidase YsdC [Eubacteriales bacterium SKADARSKE-1]|nr:putative aminopeptidase YsdC [Eubacteriales bacterium SKADARSKE-1]
MTDLKLLEKLCRASGISGDESSVRNIILSEIKDYATNVKTDALGNLIVFKAGKEKPKSKLMISAHMDEVGFIVNHITDSGFLKFSTVGGIDKKVIPGKSVTVGKNKIPGVIGVKPIHLLKPDEKQDVIPIDDMYIDIGAKNKKDAEKHVNLSDSVCFDSIFDIDGKIIKAKALDDRVGCFILINLIKNDLPFDTYFTFVVQEEIGLRGATTAAFSVDPDCALVIEATTAGDTSCNESKNPVCKVNGGAVISFMDGHTVYDKEYYHLAFNVAAENNIKVQAKEATTGGNDAGAIHVSRGGVRTLAISLPCRYLHSATGLISLNDLDAVQNLTAKLAATILATGSK